MKGFGIAAFVAMALAGGAEVVTNAFVVAEADGVRMASDGSIHFARRSPVSVKVTARPGWKVNGRRSLRFVRSSGESGTLRVTSVLGEDGEHVPYRDCTFDCTLATNHLSAPVIRADAPERILAMYALPASNAFVSASATSTLVSNGVHEIVRTWTPCPECGAEHDPPEERWTVDMVPCSYDWTARGGGTTTNSNTWAGFMSKGTDQSISFEVIGRTPCAECVCRASTNTLVDVHELSITNDLYVGLDRTDAGRSNVVTRTATANIRPLPSGRVAYSWTDCGKICSFTGRTDQASVRYCARNSGDASDAHLAEPLTVVASITNVYGLSSTATCTTNFTVVKVDVTIDGVGEDNEEIKGSFLKFAPDAPNGQWTEEGTNALKTVSITCTPTTLPQSEVVTITVPEKTLYVKYNDKYYETPSGYGFQASLLQDIKFCIHGHTASTALMNKRMSINHKTSEAKDVGRFTVWQLSFTVYVDQPGDGGDDDPVENGSVGHAFWKFTMNPADGLPSEWSKFVNCPNGFYPAISVNTLNFRKSVAGLYVSPDDTHMDGVDVSRTWQISLPEFKSGVLRSVSMWEGCQNGELKYNAITYNCVNAVIDVANAAGITLPANKGGTYWGIELGLTSGRFGEDLKE